MGVKKLTVYQVCDATNEIIKCMSSMLPNIRCIQVDYDDDEECYFDESLIICVPNTCLDQLILVNLVYINQIFNAGNDVYVSLTTKYGLMFYKGNRDGLFPVSNELYHKISEECISLTITCQDLKEIVICKIDRPVKEIRWIFNLVHN